MTPRRWSLLVGGRAVGERQDSDYTFGVTRNPGYGTMFLSGSYTVNKHFTPYLRMDNLLNERYEEVLGYTALEPQRDRRSAAWRGSASLHLRLSDSPWRPWGAPPQRIVSTAPSITEMLYAVGLGDRVVGVTTYLPLSARSAQEAEDRHLHGTEPGTDRGG